MVVIFDDELEDDTVESLCDKITNSVYSLKEGDKVDLYFSTNGGANKNRVPITNIIIKYQNYINVNIHNIMASNGFIMLMELLENNIPIYMNKEFRYSMIHKIDALLYNNRFEGYGYDMHKFIKKYNTTMSKKLEKLGLTEEQMSIYNKGQEIYFSPEETLKIFPNIIKSN